MLVIADPASQSPESMLSNKDSIRLRKAITYANGYRELAMFKDAHQELDSLPKHLREEEDTRKMRLTLCMEAEDWKRALPFAEALAKDNLEESGYIVNLAYVVRRASSMDKAKNILIEASDRFPNEAIIHYNLGCYECQENNLNAAKTRIAKAISLDPSYLDLAKKDEDLVSLKKWIQSLEMG